eukprot:CAMPEP_0202867140 /NCGR_PEP_ID=MMETSP1391-20130828/8783_1 /ASSEMBLY_ACC=CAM_ASM_000867 /TAXON_ID=1034604 /ORGANISM="Chlamydomonas leiostraca, Strain SAG 11-49" /LENGTH=88 /DNA_ID=CAMNT_0049547151 /DNA_START=49 /DNA_END=312 /DNA_ORIENTATION=-
MAWLVDVARTGEQSGGSRVCLIGAGNLAAALCKVTCTVLTQPGAHASECWEQVARAMVSCLSSDNGCELPLRDGDVISDGLTPASLAH